MGIFFDIKEYLEKTVFEISRVGCIIWISSSANVAFAALMAADVGLWDTTQTEVVRQWAKGQLDYMLGSNPNGRSYVVGFGNNPPVQPHHRAR